MLTVFLSVVAFSVGVVGCDDNHFDQAPTVRAPSAPTPKTAASAPSAQAQAPQAQQDGIGLELPANHPPLEGEGQANPAGQGAGQAGVGVPPAAGAMEPDDFGKVGPFRWEAPGNWLPVKPASAMRLAEYHMLGEQGTEPATLSIFYFGPQGGGEIQANIDRWVAQFKTLDEESAQSTQEVSGLKIHRVGASGTFDMAAAQGGEGLLEDWRMLGAIAESPTGNYFFKLTGPRETIAKHEAAFDEFVQSFRAAPAP